ERAAVEMPQVADPRNGRLLAKQHGALPGGGDHCAVVGDAEASGDARRLIDVFALAGLNGNLLDELLHELGNDDGPLPAQIGARLLLHDLDPLVALQRIMRMNHAADAVLELWDDLAAAVVRCRIR